MPPEAKVFLIDDNDHFRKTVKRSLEGKGHQVVFEASTETQAESLIEQMSGDEVNVGVVDGSLSFSMTLDCEDGHRMSTLLRAKCPGIKIVACSASSRNVANYGDAYVDKSNIEPLSDIVTSL